MMVLVVDDSRIMRNIVKNHFSEMGVRCNYVDAENGNEALEKLQAMAIDLVFCDWNMPSMSGIEFLKTMRAEEKYKDIPFIMVTSEASKTNVIEALKGGATDYVLKPINAAIFQQKLSKIIKK